MFASFEQMYNFIDHFIYDSERGVKNALPLKKIRINYVNRNRAKKNLLFALIRIISNHMAI